MDEATYGTGLNCMDGAVQGAVRKIIKKRYNVKYVDKITQPGIVKVLADNSNSARIELIKEMLWISVINHGSRVVAIAAHHGCLGNPVEKTQQLKDLVRAKITIKQIIKDLDLDILDIEIILLWVNEYYMPEEICVSEKGLIFSRVFIST